MLERFCDFEVVSLFRSEFSENIEKLLKTKIHYAEFGAFADTECFVKTPKSVSFKNKKVFILSQFEFKKRSVNDQIFEFLILSDLLKKLGATEIIAILPYIPYSRQAMSFDDSLPGPMFLIDKFFKQSGLDQVITFDFHDLSVRHYFSTKISNLSLIDFLSSYFKEHSLSIFESEKEICFLSPDTGRIASVKEISKVFGGSFAHIEKKRVDIDRAIALKLFGDVKNKNIVIIDDILDTGKTLVNGVELVLNKGANEVVAFTTHAIFSSGAFERISSSAISKLFITNSVLLKEEVLRLNNVKIFDISSFLVNFLAKEFTKA